MSEKLAGFFVAFSKEAKKTGENLKLVTTGFSDTWWLNCSIFGVGEEERASKKERKEIEKVSTQQNSNTVSRPPVERNNSSRSSSSSNKVSKEAAGLLARRVCLLNWQWLSRLTPWQWNSLDIGGRGGLLGQKKEASLERAFKTYKYLLFNWGHSRRCLGGNRLPCKLGYQWRRFPQPMRKRNLIASSEPSCIKNTSS